MATLALIFCCSPGTPVRVRCPLFSNVRSMSGSAITTPPLTYYGRYLFAHSPTYSRWARLTARDIHTILHHRAGFEGQNLWFYLNHPICWIRIVGLVVAYDDLENRHIVTRMLPLFETGGRG